MDASSKGHRWRHLISPLVLAGRSQVSKAVLFLPWEGDFDAGLAKAGDYEVKVFAKYNEGVPVLIDTQKLILEEDYLNKWRSGTTIAGQVVHREQPLRDEIILRLGGDPEKNKRSTAS